MQPWRSRGADLVPSHALGGPVVHGRPARALVRDAVHVEPVVQPDAEIDDSSHDDQQREEDERELDHRLAALVVDSFCATEAADACSSEEARRRYPSTERSSFTTNPPSPGSDTRLIVQADSDFRKGVPRKWAVVTATRSAGRQVALARLFDEDGDARHEADQWLAQLAGRTGCHRGGHDVLHEVAPDVERVARVAQIGWRLAAVSVEEIAVVPARARVAEAALEAAAIGPAESGDVEAGEAGDRIRPLPAAVERVVRPEEQVDEARVVRFESIALRERRRFRRRPRRTCTRRTGCCRDASSSAPSRSRSPSRPGQVVLPTPKKRSMKPSRSWLPLAVGRVFMHRSGGQSSHGAPGLGRLKRLFWSGQSGFVSNRFEA